MATSVIDAIAADVVMKKKGAKTPPGTDDPDVIKLAGEIRAKIGAREDKAAVRKCVSFSLCIRFSFYLYVFRFSPVPFSLYTHR